MNPLFRRSNTSVKIRAHSWALRETPQKISGTDVGAMFLVLERHGMTKLQNHIKDQKLTCDRPVISFMAKTRVTTTDLLAPPDRFAKFFHPCPPRNWFSTVRSRYPSLCRLHVLCRLCTRNPEKKYEQKTPSPGLHQFHADVSSKMVTASSKTLLAWSSHAVHS